MLFLVFGLLHGLFDQVLNVLKRISDEDCLLLGLNPKYARPDWMILQVLPDPPPHVRPSVMMDTSSRSEVSLIPIYFLCPKINIFLEIFRQIRTFFTMRSTRSTHDPFWLLLFFLFLALLMSAHR